MDRREGRKRGMGKEWRRINGSEKERGVEKVSANLKQPVSQRPL